MTESADTVEQQVLKECVRAACGTGAPDGETFLPPIDWRRLYQLANRHRVFPLVYRALSRTDHEPPAPEWSRYQAGFDRHSRSNLSHSAELISVLRVLERGRVDAVSLKGPVLGQVLYGSPALRQFRDLDVLVTREAFLHATECLEAEGYRLSWPPVHQDRKRKAAVMRHFDEQNFTFTHPARQMRLELHWQFMRSGLGEDAYETAAFARRIDVPFCGTRVSSLEPHDLVLQLCTHGAGHGWMRLSWLADLARFLETTGRTLDWDAVWSRAGEAGCRRRLLFGLHMAEGVLHAPIPQSLRPLMRRDATRLARASARTAPLQDHPRSPPAPAMVWYQLSLKDTPEGALRYLLAWIFKPRENVVGSAVLPARLFPLYYLLWPLQVILWPLRKLVRRHPRED